MLAKSTSKVYKTAQRFSRQCVQRAYKYVRRTRAIKARFTYVILRNVTQPCPDSLSVAIARNDDEPRGFAIVHGFRKKKKTRTGVRIRITLSRSTLAVREGLQIRERRVQTCTRATWISEDGVMSTCNFVTSSKVCVKKMYIFSHPSYSYDYFKFWDKSPCWYFSIYNWFFYQFGIN